MDDHKNEEQERNEEDFELTELELSLAEQISEELDGGKPEETAKKEAEPPKKKKNWFQRIPLWVRIPVISLLGLVIVLALVVNAMLDRIVVDFDDERLE